MKYFLTFILTLAIALGGIFVYKKTNLQIFSKLKHAKTSGEPKFFWGVYTNSYVFNNRNDGFIPEHLAKQIPYWQELGVNTIRFNFEHTLAKPRDKENDAIVDAITQKNIVPYMIIEHPYTDFFKEATFKGGYDWGKQIATRYKGKVKYYQLANEVSGTTVKKDFPGNHPTDYDEAKYAVLKDYLLGLSTGIRDADPFAKRIVTAHWIATAIIDRLYDDGLPFEVIGWDWYSEMGDDLTQKKLDDGTTLDIPAHFKRMSKPFWIVEINHEGGDFKDPTGRDQAKYIDKAVMNALNSKEIQGFIVFRLFTSFSADNGVPSLNNSFGIVKDKLNPTTNEFEPGTKNPAFETYKNLIKKYPQGLLETK